MVAESLLTSITDSHIDTAAPRLDRNRCASPRVSVVVAVYNQQSLITTCVRSVQSQTISDLEIIIVDDASTDATAAVIAELATRDPRISLVRSEKNTGPGLARNRGIALATGTWVALLDADDAYHPDRLRCLLETAEAADADMVADNLWLCHAGRELEPEVMLGASELLEATLVDAAEFVSRNITSGGGRRIAYGFLKPMIRKSFLTAHNIRYDDARFAEDFLLYLRCLIAGAQWVVIPAPLYYYTVSDRSLTNQSRREDLLRIMTIESELLGTEAVRRDRQLSDAIEKHRQSVTLAQSWSGFAEALKRIDPVAAMSSLISTPGAFVHIGRESIRAVPRALARLSKAA
jgi:glycosyltransferase involved in cell wall biosynthesis